VTPGRASRILAGLCAAALTLTAAAAAWAKPASALPERATILVMVRMSADHHRPSSGYGGDYGDRQAVVARHRIAVDVARRHGLALTDQGWPMPLLGLDCFVMIVPADKSVGDAVAEVTKDPQVAWSQPVQSFEAQGGVTRSPDPLFAVQPAAKAWRLADLHKAATGKGVTVAVIDSRVDTAHPDLIGQVAVDEDFVVGRPSGPERHGTGVAGVIAAKADNGIGIAGIAPDAQIMALRACWETGQAAAAPTVCDSLSLAKALHFAIDHRAGVINLSLAGPHDPLLEQLIGVALSRRIAVVAAFDGALPQGGFPASQAGVIAVAIDSLQVYPVRVYGAPGRDVPTTQPGGKWILVNGSSYAAAHVSGLVALVREDRVPAARAVLVSASPAGGLIDACATLLGAAKCTDAAQSLAAR
jgi:subtilisin family serine protease